MIVREPFETAYQAEQARRAEEDAQREEAWMMEAGTLEELVRRWGIELVLNELKVIHQRLTPDGSQLRWTIPSEAYLTGHYDDPNPCSCDEF
jgi:hypothetical protein